MADNLTLQTAAPATPAAGVKPATREVAYSGDTVHVPIAGLAAFAGADDAKTVQDIGGDAANGLDVDVTRLPGTVAPDILASRTALEIVDDWDESDRAKVNPVVGQAGVAAGAGAVDAKTQRVTLASDDPVAAAMGTKDDAAATTDAGSFGLIALVKRLLEKLTAQLPAALTAGGNLRVSLQESNATQPVSGSVSVSALPATTLAGQTAKTADFDTGAGVDQVAMLGIAVPKAGGAVAGGTAADPLRTDPTGTTTQPISAAALPLPAGAATEAKQDSQIAALGAQADAEATGNGSIIAILKRLRTLLSGGLPAALGAQGGLKIEGVAGGAAVPASVAAASLGDVGQQADAEATGNGTLIAVLKRLRTLLNGGLPAALSASGFLKTVRNAETSGGWTPYKLNAAASTNATSVKASAGQLGWLVVVNTNAAARYLKVYNNASAPTVGTDIPVLVIPVPGNAAGAGVSINFGPGTEFTTGIAFALTTGAADSDTGAVAANELIVSLGYK